MFWDVAATHHGLAHDPFKALVAPRPIGWIGTRGLDGVANLAPYSFFNALFEEPYLVMFASDGIKDSARNARDTGVFTCSMVSLDLADAMNRSSAVVPPEVDEFDLAELEKAEGQLVAAPYVKNALSVLECRLTEIIRPKDLAGNLLECHMVVGQVVGIHIDESILVNGLVDLEKARPVARLGYRQYSDVSRTFELTRPGKT